MAKTSGRYKLGARVGKKEERLRAGPARQLREENASLKKEVTRLNKLVERLQAELRATTNANLEQSADDARPHIRRARAALMR